MPERPFSEPWQALVFALVVSLQDRGVIAKAQWAGALGAAIVRAQQRGDPDRGDTYYGHWVDALETLLEEGGVATHAQLDALAQAWHDAAGRTPHGRPIELDARAWAIARRGSD